MANPYFVIFWTNNITEKFVQHGDFTKPEVGHFR
jgi:hypothetical protein